MLPNRQQQYAGSDSNPFLVRSLQRFRMSYIQPVFMDGENMNGLVRLLQRFQKLGHVAGFPCDSGASRLEGREHKPQRSRNELGSVFPQELPTACLPSLPLRRESPSHAPEHRPSPRPGVLDGTSAGLEKEPESAHPH